jgi:S1-C subfamily serine protease
MPGPALADRLIHTRPPLAYRRTMSSTSPLQSLSNAVASLVAASARATVAIRGRGQRPTTGTVVSADEVVAIHHTLDLDEVTVHTDDGRAIDAKVAGRDETRDLALLKVAGLAGVPLETATAPARPGEIVVAVSRNWLGSVSASLGVVGAAGGPVRFGHGIAVERIVRADVASTKGISGGALVSASGTLIGILNAGLSRGVPLALPADEVERSRQALATHGRVRRGFLGVGLQPVRLPERQQAGHRDGLMIVALEPGGPADLAGLLVGDVIVSAGGEALREVEDLQRWLAADRVGQALALQIVRGAAATDVTVTVLERP